MRAILFACLVLLGNSALAQDLKIYIGTAENFKPAPEYFFMQLIICNNSRDTVFMRRETFDNIYPLTTADVSEVTNNGTRYLLTGGKNLGEKFKPNSGITGNEEGQLSKLRLAQIEKSKENDALVQVERERLKYYVIAPNKCITVETVAHPGFVYTSAESLNPEPIEAYLAIHTWYYTHADSTVKKELLISRASEDLKKCIFFNVLK